MTIKECKEWLSRARKTDEEINALILEQERALTNATSTVAQSGSEKVQMSNVNTSENKFISYAAYKRMQTDPEYEKKILDALAKNKAVNFGNYIPQISYMHIDDTYEKCYGYTQGMKENDSYSGSSSAKGTDAGRQKKARQKELLEEYLEKRAQAKKQQLEMLNKKIAKMELERSRQTQSWNSERQMAKASNAYDANIMMEAELVKNITKGENNGNFK